MVGALRLVACRRWKQALPLALASLSWGCALGPWEPVKVTTGPVRREEHLEPKRLERQILAERDAQGVDILVRDVRRCELRIQESRVERVEEERKPNAFMYIDAGLFIGAFVVPQFMPESKQPGGASRMEMTVMFLLPTTPILLSQIFLKRERTYRREVKLGSEVFPTTCGSEVVANQALLLVRSDGTWRKVSTDGQGRARVRLAPEQGLEIRIRGVSIRKVPPWADSAQ
ncbi:MAG: hypothetical protein KC492_31875 [Myxococcales bacterium]|nr:hypothetical protein [Myxococcales bacterium]MCB9609655.1 hypothetical protein [Polyangiaceae bacterium]